MRGFKHPRFICCEVKRLQKEKCRGEIVGLMTRRHNFKLRVVDARSRGCSYPTTWPCLNAIMILQSKHGNLRMQTGEIFRCQKIIQFCPYRRTNAMGMKWLRHPRVISHTRHFKKPYLDWPSRKFTSGSGVAVLADSLPDLRYLMDANAARKQSCCRQV